MNRTAPALALALLASCAATRAATGALETDVLELKALVSQLDRAYATGDAELAARLEAEIEVAAAEARESATAVKAAVDQDLQAAKDGLLGLSQGGTQGGLIGLALTGAAWFLRDRRKKLGRDPVQVAELEKRVNGAA